MTNRPEWIKCICTGGRQDPSICSRPHSANDWRFVDAAHAIESIARDSRLVPCPECMRIIDKDSSR